MCVESLGVVFLFLFFFTFKTISSVKRVNYFFFSSFGCFFFFFFLIVWLELLIQC